MTPNSDGRGVGLPKKLRTAINKHYGRSNKQKLLAAVKNRGTK